MLRNPSVHDSAQSPQDKDEHNEVMRMIQLLCCYHGELEALGIMCVVIYEGITSLETPEMRGNRHGKITTLLNALT